MNMKKYFSLQSYSYKKIVMNFIFSFFLTIFIFCIPMSQKDSFYQVGPKLYEKLEKGALLSTIISINGTYMITLYSRIMEKFKFSSADLTDSSKSFVLIFELLKYQVIPFLLSLLSFLFLGQVQGDKKLHWFITIVESVLYIFSLLFYGYTEKIFSNEDLVSSQVTYEQKLETKQIDAVRNILNSTEADKIREMRQSIKSGGTHDE